MNGSYAMIEKLLWCPPLMVKNSKTILDQYYWGTSWCKLLWKCPPDGNSTPAHSLSLLYFLGTLPTLKKCQNFSNMRLSWPQLHGITSLLCIDIGYSIYHKYVCSNMFNPKNLRTKTGGEYTTKIFPINVMSLFSITRRFGSDAIVSQESNG